MSKKLNLYYVIELEIVDNFFYLGKSLNSKGGSDVSIVTQVRTTWGKIFERNIGCQLSVKFSNYNKMSCVSLDMWDIS